MARRLRAVIERLMRDAGHTPPPPSERLLELSELLMEEAAMMIPPGHA